MTQLPARKGDKNQLFFFQHFFRYLLDNSRKIRYTGNITVSGCLVVAGHQGNRAVTEP